MTMKVEIGKSRIRVTSDARAPDGEWSLSAGEVSKPATSGADGPWFEFKNGVSFPLVAIEAGWFELIDEQGNPAPKRRLYAVYSGFPQGLLALVSTAEEILTAEQVQEYIRNLTAETGNGQLSILKLQIVCQETPDVGYGDWKPIPIELPGAEGK